MNIPDSLRVSISGIRGKVDEGLSLALIQAFTRAYVNSLPTDGEVVISWDGRQGGKDIYNLVYTLLGDLGIKIKPAGIIPLPTTQVAIMATQAVGGICVTASHNPQPYNGLKFLSGEGEFISEERLNEIVGLVRQTPNEKIELKNLPSSSDFNTEARDLHLRYLPRVLAGRQLVVAVDAVNAAGSNIIPQALREWGCEVLPIACNESQTFPHKPEPTPDNLEWTKQQLKNQRFDFGVVVDPDADRLCLINEKANILSEELTLPLVIQEVLERVHQPGPIVVNLSTSRQVEDMAKLYKREVLYSPIGERNVVNMMKDVQAVFGGEGNGGVIDPNSHYGRDSLVGIAYIVSLLRRTKKPLSELVEKLPKYRMRKDKRSIKRANLPLIFDRIKATFPDAVFDERDGLRVDQDWGWIQIRASNTEPVVRIIGEARRKDELEEMFCSVQRCLAI